MVLVLPPAQFLSIADFHRICVTRLQGRRHSHPAVRKRRQSVSHSASVTLECHLHIFVLRLTATVTPDSALIDPVLRRPLGPLCLSVPRPLSASSVFWGAWNPISTSNCTCPSRSDRSPTILFKFQVRIRCEFSCTCTALLCSRTSVRLPAQAGLQATRGVLGAPCRGQRAQAAAVGLEGRVLNGV